MKKSQMKEFLRTMGRMQEEDYVTTDELYKIFNTVLEAVKASQVDNSGKLKELDSFVNKKSKELETYFAKMLEAVDKRMSQVKDGNPGKDGTSPIAGVDYPDYQEIRDFIKDAIEKLPTPDDPAKTITVDYIKDQLMALEGHDRLPHTAIDGIEDFIDEKVRLMEANLRRGPMAITGGGTGSGSSGATTLSALTDTTISSPSNGEVLQYNGSAWVNATIAGTGDVTAAATFGTDNVLIKSDGTSKGVQATGITIADTTDAMSGMSSITLDASGSLLFGAVTVLSDSAGTTTLSNIDALDATTEATIEAAIDTLANLTSATSLSITESQISDLGAYITDVVSDTTPQLGGSLDVNGNKIVSTANGNIDIEPNGTGDVLLGNFVFDADQTVGAGQDNYVLTYDNAGGKISLEAATGGGIANVVEDTTPQLGGDLASNGNSIRMADANGIYFGTGNDLLLYHDGSDHQILGNNGDFLFDNSSVTKGYKFTLGTDTSATYFEVRNNTTTVLFSVDGDGTVTLPTGLTGVIRADSGVVSVDTDVTDIVSAASDTTAGKVELATTAETNTGTDTGRAVTPDALAGSNFGIRYVQVTCFDYTTDTATGDGKGYFHIPAAMNGMNLVEVHAEVITAGTTGTTDIQIANVTQAADMLTTKITIDSAETGSDTAATAAVIDTANDDVATNDLIRIDVDAVSTTPAKGLIVTLGFQLP